MSLKTLEKYEKSLKDKEKSENKTKRQKDKKLLSQTQGKFIDNAMSSLQGSFINTIKHS